jgi:hypothetical protein
VAGSTPFLIEPSDNFERSFKKLAKTHNKGNFAEIIEKVLEELIEKQYPPNSRQEPLPSNLKLSEDWTFHKLTIRFSKGASGQIRLMYLVNKNLYVIRLVWLYSHEQFSKRPEEKDLKGVIAVVA